MQKILLSLSFSVYADEPSRVTLKNTGILYSPFEKCGAKLIYWDTTKNDFVQVVMND